MVGLLPSRMISDRGQLFLENQSAELLGCKAVALNFEPGFRFACCEINFLFNERARNSIKVKLHPVGLSPFRSTPQSQRPNCYPVAWEILLGVLDNFC